MSAKTFLSELPLAVKVDLYTRNIDPQQLHDYISTSLEYQHWVLNDDCVDGSDPQHFLTFMAPVSRAAFLNDFQQDS